MTGFIVTTIHVTDPVAFQRYVEAVRGGAETHGGEILVRGHVTEMLEGKSCVGDLVVVARFPTAAEARAYVGSRHYQSGKALRAGAAEVEMRLISDEA